MPEISSSLTQVVSDDDAHITRVPIVQEDVHVDKKRIDIERVTLRTGFDEEQVVVRDDVRREHVEITRVAIEREVTAAPPIRTEGDVTIIPVIEERLVVEKRLFLVEELRVTRSASVEPVELPATLRRTRVDVERTDLRHPAAPADPK